jgi:hypothetical protein
MPVCSLGAHQGDLTREGMLSELESETILLHPDGSGSDFLCPRLATPPSGSQAALDFSPLAPDPSIFAGPAAIAPRRPLGKLHIRLKGLKGIHLRVGRVGRIDEDGMRSVSRRH